MSAMVDELTLGGGSDNTGVTSGGNSMAAEAGFAGAAAGFATMISNAAGPIMSVYMSGLKMPKDEFMGTTAWYFFLLNVSKIPVYLLLGAFMQPFFTRETLLFNLAMSPFIIAGVFLGRLIFKYIPQKWFVNIVLALAAFAAIRLIVG